MIFLFFQFAAQIIWRADNTFQKQRFLQTLTFDVFEIFDISKKNIENLFFYFCCFFFFFQQSVSVSQKFFQFFRLFFISDIYFFRFFSIIFLTRYRVANFVKSKYLILQYWIFFSAISFCILFYFFLQFSAFFWKSRLYSRQ